MIGLSGGGPGGMGGLGGPGGKAGARVRPQGGFNPAGLGAGNEHLDEAAMQAAAKQNQLTQQQASTAPGSGKSGSNPLLSKSDANKGSQKPQTPQVEPPKPREVAGLGEELIKRPLKDIKKGLSSIFDLQALFNVNLADTPQEAAKKKQLHQRFQKLTQEQQQVAQKNYQEKLQKKKMEEEEEAQKKQQEEQEKASKASLAPPSSPKKGPVGPAAGQSKKKQAQAQLQQSRQGLGKVGQQH